MTEELLPNIVSFLHAIPPFDRLPSKVLQKIAAQVDILWLDKGMPLNTQAEPPGCLYILRTGAVEQRHLDGTLRARLGAEDIFGFSLLHALKEQRVEYHTLALENTLLYRLAYAPLQDSISDYPQVLTQLALSAWRRLHSALNVQWSEQDKGIFFRLAGDVANRSIAIAAPHMSVQQVATLMSLEIRTSCAFIVNDKGTLIGMMTDKDMTKRVIAPGKDSQVPVTEVMTDNLHTVFEDELVMRAVSLMMSHNIRNIPVIDREFRPIGLLTPQQLIQKNSVQAIFLIEQISRAASIDALVNLTPVRQAIFETLLDGNVAPHIVGLVLTMIYDAVTRRLTELAIDYLGEAPCAWSWMAAGSHARHEVHLASDQDNALLLADSATATDRQWFSHFAMYVCKGLAACGYPLCEGRFMAATPAWCQRLTVWKDYYRKWASNPEYDGLLKLNVFIEIRHVAGDEALFATLDAWRQQVINHNPRLLKALLRNALKIRPPLGIFHNLVLEKDGNKEKILNIKRAAIHGVVDIVRLHALSAGIPQQNTEERIQALLQQCALNDASAQDMLGTWRYVTQLRYLHQSHALQRGEEADNSINPERFGSLERQHLKDAFRMLSGFQDAAKMAFGG
ncbi:DUF294 nucleotidyltransferase-like domain-containing protein [Erwinia sp. HR93]|uniref:DUF294 nucleotidyltransferase-like domain-containing protein n=1 Tax=Erwinia sp. HR93 TaxID=3094840 RepID=UPI002ADEDB84|nr:DUF294 nucleotidyltransferase-like domain-containing protein [Erwinia sp. HR93]MEA1064101.1 DUF294 nucleotidyltransferase-like domain-containing protein [Erwinia sp. HR93]